MGPQQLLSLLTVLSLYTLATAFSTASIQTTSLLLPQNAASQYLLRENCPALYATSGDPSIEEDDEDDDDYEQIYKELMGGDQPEDFVKKPPNPNNENKNTNKKQPSGKQKTTKKPHDNRDNLPFLVQVLTPPEQPYEQVVQKKVKKKVKRKHRNLKGGHQYDHDDDDDEIIGETLGEFRFEKNTGSGDKIEIDNQVYLVTRAKCQYRYAGAQKFEMVRKILQVKPVQRAMQEEYILRQFNAPSARESE